MRKHSDVINYLYKMNVLLLKLTAKRPSYTFTRRAITIDAKMSSDPYYVLGVDRQTAFP